VGFQRKSSQADPAEVLKAWFMAGRMIEDFGHMGSLERPTRLRITIDTDSEYNPLRRYVLRNIMDADGG
jgi:hypothetical protein